MKNNEKLQKDKPKRTQQNLSSLFSPLKCLPVLQDCYLLYQIWICKKMHPKFIIK